MTGMEVLLNDATRKYVHHYVVYACTDEVSDVQSGTQMKKGSCYPIEGWTPGKVVMFGAVQSYKKTYVIHVYGRMCHVSAIHRLLCCGVCMPVLPCISATGSESANIVVARRRQRHLQNLSVRGVRHGPVCRMQAVSGDRSWRVRCMPQPQRKGAGLHGLQAVLGWHEREVARVEHALLQPRSRCGASRPKWLPDVLYEHPARACHGEPVAGDRLACLLYGSCMALV